MADVESRLHNVLKEITEEQNYHNSEIKLKSISSGGANYTSQLFAITISESGKEDLKLFAKIATLGEQMRSMSDIQVYEIEIQFYTKVLPKYRQLEEAHNVPEEERLLLPKYYGGTAEYMNEILVLEDFSAKGYKEFNRFKCFDWEYASKCVSELARLHALSVAFEKNDPEEYTKITSKFKFVIPPEKMRELLNKSIVIAIEATDTIYKTRVELFLKNCMKNNTYMKFYKPERRLTLKHGDFRPNNIIHKVDADGKVTVVVLDYQVLQQGNPVTDLLYFLISGSDEQFREKHLRQFFDHYYEEFSKSLRRLGLDPDDVYTEKDYRGDVEQMLPFGLTLSTFMLPFITVEEDNAPKPEGFDIGKYDIKVSDLFSVRFNGLVRDYVKLGFL